MLTNCNLYRVPAVMLFGAWLLLKEHLALLVKFDLFGVIFLILKGKNCVSALLIIYYK